MEKAKDSDKVVAPYEIQNSLPFRSPLSSVEILKSVSNEMPMLPEEEDIENSSSETKEESIAYFRTP